MKTKMKNIMGNKMKNIIAVLVISALSGCASMSDRGDVSQTSVKLPDGSKITFVRIQRIRLFTPSTEEKVTFIEKPGIPIVRVDNLEQNYQNGMGPSLISGAIQAGATVGGAYLIGEGLRDSGDKNTVNNGSSSGSAAGAISGSRSSSRSSSYNRNTNINRGNRNRGRNR